MDPLDAIKAIMRGERAAEHARAYNEWRAGQGFAVEVMLPEPYEIVPRQFTRYASIARVYRGHRGWRARVEREGGQGFVHVNVADPELA